MGKTTKNMSKNDISNNLIKLPLQLSFAKKVKCKGIASEHFRRMDYQSCTVEYVESGKGYLETNNEYYEVSKGDIYILHKHSNNYYYPDQKTPWTKIFFSISGFLPELLFQAYSLDKINYLPNCMDLKIYFEKMLRNYSLRGELMHHEAALIFHELVMDMAEINNHRLYNLSNDILRIKNHFDMHLEKPLNLKDACRELGFSEGHLIRLFKAHMGVTPYAYLLNNRIEHAKHLLTHSNLFINEIADSLQFCDPLYFSNYFKKQTGLSPREFRKRSLS